MKRILFDTSIYGILVTDKETSFKLSRLIPHEIVVYGISLIRKELRDTPKQIEVEHQNLRIALLELYDSFIKKENHNLKVNDFVVKLAESYFIAYKKNKGHISRKAMYNDLVIVATATLYQLDIVVSSDVRTMLSEKAMRSYRSVNKKFGFKDPEFITYEQFKRKLAR